jgi:hypothetical protein
MNSPGLPEHFTSADQSTRVEALQFRLAVDASCAGTSRPLMKYSG